MINLLQPKSPGAVLLLRHSLSRNPNHEEFPIGFPDCDALVIAALVRADEELLPCITGALQHELLVRPVHAELHGVLAAYFHTGESAEAIPPADFHSQRLLCLVHDHGCHLGCHLDDVRVCKRSIDEVSNVHNNFVSRTALWKFEIAKV